MIGKFTIKFFISHTIRMFIQNWTCVLYFVARFHKVIDCCLTLRKFFSDNTRVRIVIFFCRAKREFLFQNLTLGYMTKTLNHIIFFPPPKSEYFFHQHWESEWSVPNQIQITGYFPSMFLWRHNCQINAKKVQIWYI